MNVAHEGTRRGDRSAAPSSGQFTYSQNTSGKIATVRVGDLKVSHENCVIKAPRITMLLTDFKFAQFPSPTSAA